MPGMEDTMTKIRTRYAPSPTGKMHVGNLRSALYEFLIAKHEGGDFMLRIEDTDQERFVEGATEIIYRTMEKTGLIHDEGPDKDGGYGPYVQSERMKTGIYMEYAKKLIETGEAYYCFCDKERLASLKTEIVEGKEIMIYDKHCLHIRFPYENFFSQSGIRKILLIVLIMSLTANEEVYGPKYFAFLSTRLLERLRDGKPPSTVNLIYG
jgi:glutamyl/glutaminyl-tRNA synthetase